MSGMPVKARFCNGVIVPLEPLELEEGAELRITVTLKPILSDEEGREALRKAAGGWVGLGDGEALKRELHRAKMLGSGLDPEESYDDEEPAGAGIMASSGGWAGLLDNPEEFIREIYEARLLGSGIDPKEFYAE